MLAFLVWISISSLNVRWVLYGTRWGSWEWKIHPITQLPLSSCCPGPWDGGLESAFGMIRSFIPQWASVFIYQHGYSFLQQTHPYQASLRAIPGLIIHQLCILSGPHFPHLWMGIIAATSQVTVNIRVCWFHMAPLRHVLTVPCSEKHRFPLWCGPELLFSEANHPIALSLSFPISKMEKITVPPL